MRRRGKRVVFVTNNSSRDRAFYAERLRHMGLPVGLGEIVISSDATIAYLTDRGVHAVFTVGTGALRRALAAAGIEPEANNPQFVLVGYDTELTYQRIARASQFLLRGVPLLATHADLVCPTPDGPIPDAGAILALLRAATGAQPQRVFGKPDPNLIEWVVRRERLDWSEVAVIGDRLYTDGELARRAGASYVAVLSGETSREQIETSDLHVDLILRDITELV
jgi:HAD superfamily hydrolase (TIGR01450 family)